MIREDNNLMMMTMTMMTIWQVQYKMRWVWSTIMIGRIKKF